MIYNYTEHNDILLTPKISKKINALVKTSNINIFLKEIKKINPDEDKIVKYIFETGVYLKVSDSEFITNQESLIIIKTNSFNTFIYKNDDQEILINMCKVFPQFDYQDSKNKKIFQLVNKFLFLRLINKHVNIYWKTFDKQWKRVNFNNLYTKDTIYGFSLLNHPETIFEL